MIRQALSIGGRLLLAGAMALATPGSGLAQRGSGGHAGGGGHFGGGHFGGANFGGFRGRSFNGPARFGGFHNARPFYGSYGYYPYYYGSYGYDYPYYYDANPAGSDLPYDPGYVSPSVTPDSAGNSQSLYVPSTAAAQADTLAHVTVRVPADARLWFENTPMPSIGAVREFNSPPLTPGGRYTYDVRASWTENGHEVTQSQQVGVSAGASVEVDFPVQSATAAQPSVTPTR